MTIRNESELQPACESIRDFVNNLTFGRYVRNLRKADGMTQQELANKIGCKKQFISAVEKGREQVNLDFACRIANAMGYAITPFAQVLFRQQLKQYASHARCVKYSKNGKNAYMYFHTFKKWQKRLYGFCTSPKGKRKYYLVRVCSLLVPWLTPLFL